MPVSVPMKTAAEALALRRLLPTSGQRLLELGAGAGRNTPRYAGFDEIVLLDYSTTQLEQARQRLGDSRRYRYVAADIYRLPFADAQFDAATLIRTLHHFKDAPLALDQVRRVLADGADFILEFANKRNLKAILRYLLRRQPWNPFTLEQVEFAALNFDFHPRTVTTWLAQRGFSVQRRLAVSLFRLGFLKRVLPLKVLMALESPSQRLGALYPLSPSVFLACQSARARRPCLKSSSSAAQPAIPKSCVKAQRLSPVRLANAFTPSPTEFITSKFLIKFRICLLPGFLLYYA